MTNHIDYEKLTARQFRSVIKKCPFCGSRNVTLYEYGVVPDPHVRCNKCNAQTAEYNNRTQAIEAWNRRSGVS